ncbi:MAG TPA: peptidoglycan recognition family protein [Marmoricola sp.]|jgi:hypothetical protein
MTYLPSSLLGKADALDFLGSTTPMVEDIKKRVGEGLVGLTEAFRAPALSPVPRLGYPGSPGAPSGRTSWEPLPDPFAATASAPDPFAARPAPPATALPAPRRAADSFGIESFALPSFAEMTGGSLVPEAPTAPSRGTAPRNATDTAAFTLPSFESLTGAVAPAPLAADRAPLGSGPRPSLAGASPPPAAAAGAPGEIEAFIRQAASARGINPDIAVQVARAEGGLSDPVRQSDVVYRGRREQSYGPLQLNVEGGVGSAAIKAGIDPRNPAHWRRAVEFGLDEVARAGWGQWHAAAPLGIENRTGLESARPIGVTAPAAAAAVVAAPAARPTPGEPGGPPLAPGPVWEPPPAAAAGPAPTAQVFATPNLGGPRTGTRGIVVHSTRGQGATPEAELQGTLSWFANPQSQVSAHAVIGTDGSIYTVGDLDRQTWHAGENNADRLGIELVQSARDNERGVPFTDAQYRSLAQLTADWSRRYGFAIDRNALVGHEELEQGKRSGKSDPGHSFNWDRYVQSARALGGPTAAQSHPQPAAQALHQNVAAAFERANGRPPTLDEARELQQLGFGLG